MKAARLDLVITHPISTSQVYSSDGLTKTSEALRRQPKAGKRECEAWCVAHSSVSPTSMRKNGETKYLKEEILPAVSKDTEKQETEVIWREQERKGKRRAFYSSLGNAKDSAT
jgi:hypothetical protein